MPPESGALAYPVVNDPPEMERGEMNATHQDRRKALFARTTTATLIQSVTILEALLVTGNASQEEIMARAWTIDELMRDDEDDRKTDNSDLLEMAIDVAVELLERAGGTRAKPPELAWATRLIYEVLREIAAGGGQIDRQSVMIWGRRLIAALRTDSTSSG